MRPTTAARVLISDTEVRGVLSAADTQGLLSVEIVVRRGRARGRRRVALQVEASTGPTIAPSTVAFFAGVAVRRLADELGVEEEQLAEFAQLLMNVAHAFESPRDAAEGSV